MAQTKVLELPSIVYFVPSRSEPIPHEVNKSKVSFGEKIMSGSFR